MGAGYLAEAALYLGRSTSGILGQTGRIQDGRRNIPAWRLTAFGAGTIVVGAQPQVLEECIETVHVVNGVLEIKVAVVKIAVGIEGDLNLHQGI